MARSNAAAPIFGVPALHERHDHGRFIARHRHDVGYITLLLSGSYEEHGDKGRFVLEPGRAIIHRPFEAHQNVIADKGARMITFRAPTGLSTIVYGEVADADTVVRLAERNDQLAQTMLLSSLSPLAASSPRDWPDLLSDWLRDNPHGTVTRWAEERGMSREAASRGFRKAFGIEPVRYRWECRAQSALRAIISDDAPLSRIAAEQGFADQAHLTRQVRAMTGSTPSQWRRSHSFKTERPEKV